MARETQRVLITGGAGFIGSHLVDNLLERGFEVGILDSLVEQVHHGETPEWTKAQQERGLECFWYDVRDADDVGNVLTCFRPNTVVHLAAEVGVGQAEYELSRYVSTNVGGTATLIEQIIKANDTAGESDEAVRRLVTAGSMSSYGEGLFMCPEHGIVRPIRTNDDLAAGVFKVRCPYSAAKDPCKNVDPLQSMAIEEWSSLNPAGLYAATKRDTEELVMWAQKQGLSTATLRLFNVMGPRQSLRNPYTGVCAIFAARVLAGLPPKVYEDGLQTRDFIHVLDVVGAFGLMIGDSRYRLAMRTWANQAYNDVFNVATGSGTQILDVANIACNEINHKLTPEVTGQFRSGDIRSCIGNAQKLSNLTGWTPEIDTETGLRQLFWTLKDQAEKLDVAELNKAHEELEQRRMLGAPTADPGHEKTGWV